ncbi:MAG: class I SAM-dependent methyltransferase [Desulfurococcaceae archaeon]
MKQRRGRDPRLLVFKNMATYELISSGYRSWRQKPWRIIKVFNRFLEKHRGNYVLDLGSGPCVNGIDLVKGRNNYLLCLDISFSMSRISKENIERNNILGDSIAADLLYLPLRENSIDLILSIASLHHIPPEMMRRALIEIKRIMKPRGRALITMWSWRQLRFLLKQVMNKALEIAGILFDSREFFISWRTRKGTYYRYYHLYTLEELKELCISMGFKVLSSGYTCYLRNRSDNIYVIIDKNKASK